MSNQQCDIQWARNRVAAAARADESRRGGEDRCRVDEAALLLNGIVSIRTASEILFYTFVKREDGSRSGSRLSLCEQNSGIRTNPHIVNSQARVQGGLSNTLFLAESCYKLMEVTIIF
ncbi:hypothetical protein IDH44_02525 [Paenibacillus sp. IB182496]|uniref:Uncharacterized protein n=1 Tax=Paenibacillus sabuli TaxID=2772509 RepID=A0A927GQ68_9BACL|nr:hypothetical protein [Paenibacillus sabuli]MBD2844053.1 hypothetical protein [Paenibacillus sabuli]